MIQLQAKILKIHEFIESKAGHWALGIVVILNALILGAMTFKAIPHHIIEFFHHVDQIILGIFTAELFVKIWANGFSFFKKKWNLFDFIIIALSFVHHQEYFLILRTLRVLHLLEMLDASPKMMHILSGIGKAIPGVLHVLGILVLFFYIYAVMGVFLFQDLGDPAFDHIGSSMKTMFQVLTGDDWVKIMNTTEEKARYAAIYYISFYVVIVFVILNLFIGVVVGALQAAEEEIFKPNSDEEEQQKIQAQLERLEKKIDSLKAHMNKTAL